MSTEQNDKTREQWLNEAAELLWPRVIAAGGERPEKCRISCGWPSRSPLMRASSASRRIGECWSGGSEDKAREIFISPALAQPVEVMDVLLHELIHAALPADVGHRHPFPSIAKKVGLEGKPTSTFAGEALVEELKAFAKQLGRYPHAKLDQAVRPKQEARQKKVECPDCGCVVRMARSWIDLGLPTCQCGARMVSLEHGDVESEGPAVELRLRESMARYVTADGAYELSTTKSADSTGMIREGSWYVVERESGRLSIRRNREDALAFIAAVQAGEAEFPQVEVDDDAEEELEELSDFLDDDELELPDYDDGEWDPEHDEYPQPEAA